MKDIDKAIEGLDVSLFDHVLSQSTDWDKRSLLALQLVARQRNDTYVYLEIGSYLGGSIQPHVQDAKCVRIYSIDPRPSALSDVRGRLSYVDNSTAAMMERLSTIPHADLTKIRNIQHSTDHLIAAEFIPKPTLCFIDGEHTDAAVLRDAMFSLNVAEENSCIVFHDSNLVYRGIQEFLYQLERANRRFRAYFLPDSVFCVEIGDRFAEGIPQFNQTVVNAWHGYLWSLSRTSGYRDFYYHPVFEILRRQRAWVGRLGYVLGLRRG